MGSESSELDDLFLSHLSEKGRVHRSDLGGGDGDERPIVSASAVRTGLLERARVGSIATLVVLDGLAIRGVLNLADISFPFSLRLIDCHLDSDIDLSRAKVGGEFDLERSVCAGSLIAEQATFTGGLRWRFARFKEVNLNYCVVQGNVVLQDMKVSGSASFYGARFGADVALQRAEIRGVDFCRAEIIGTLGAEGAVFEDRFYLEAARVTGSVFLREATFKQGIHAVSISVGQHLQLRQSTISGPVDLTEAHIGKELHLERDTLKGRPIWRQDARLVLRNAYARTLAASVGAFRIDGPETFIELDLVGFKYDNLGGLGGRGSSGTSSAASFAAASLDDLLGFLRAGTEGWGEFAPDAYVHLAAALRKAGQSDRASTVLVELGLYERRCQSTGFWRKMSLHLLGAIIGFGHRNHYALAWLVALVLFGGAGAWLAAGAGSSRSEHASLLDCLTFSLGNVLAIVTFDEGPKSFARALNVSQASANWIVTALYLQKILGFVLITYLAAGIAGLVGRTPDRA